MIEIANKVYYVGVNDRNKKSLRGIMATALWC